MDDDGFDVALRERIARFAPAPSTEPALERFHATRIRRRRRRRVGFALVSFVVLLASGFALRAALDAGAEDSSRVITDPGETMVPTTTLPAEAGAATPLPDVLGLDYRDANAALEAAGFPRGGQIRWSIDTVTPGRFGEVLGMTPSAGETLAAGQDILVSVAADEDALGLGPQDVGPHLVGTTDASPPAGLRPGVVDSTTAPECPTTPGGRTGSVVRFLHGEVVGCWYFGFIWLDEVADAMRPLATMPDVIGLTQGEARALISAVSPDVVPTTSIEQALRDELVVLGASPRAGEPITRVDGIQLEVGDLLARDAPEVRARFYAQNPACASRLAARREVPAGRDAIEVAFEQLFAGPTREETSLGATFPSADASALRSVELRDGVLTVDVAPLRDWLEGTATTSCGSQVFLSAVQATAFQFAGVDAVRLTQDSSCEDASAFFEGSGCNTYTRTDWLNHR